MDIALPTPLLGGLSPQAFMRRHWQKKPLLIRQAVPDAAPLVRRAELFEMGARDDVESRLVTRVDGRWTLRHGPIPRRRLPALAQRQWTLLVQGVDLHVPAAHALLQRFRFVSDARLDDVMLSYASDGGGVGPHVDSYDVFLLQTAGRRRWRVARPQRRARFVADAPLKILADWAPEHDWLLAAGDMLYLPPGWGHEGTAEGDCLTASIGFRAPGGGDIARDVLQRVLDAADSVDGHGAPDAPPPRPQAIFRDADEPATAEPGRIPPSLRAFANADIERALADPDARARALGEVLSEPKPTTWFEANGATSDPASAGGARLDRRTRMLHDERFVFINGESHRLARRDGVLMRKLSNQRFLEAAEIERLSDAARALLAEWLRAGWVHAESRGG